MGFTLRAALAALGKDARIEVAELVPEVVAWARGPMAEIFAGCLDDPRVTVSVDDVGRLIRPPPSTTRSCSTSTTARRASPSPPTTASTTTPASPRRAGR